MIEPSELPLRDIHLPPPVGWWPLAPGWWLLAAGVAIALLGAALFTVRWRRTRVRRLARRRLAAIEAAFRQHGDAHRLAGELSMLCRQIALALPGAGRDAALTGEAWLARLDAFAPGAFFTHGAGRVLLTAPYDAGQEIAADTLLAGIATWLSRLDPSPDRQPTDA